MDKVRVYLSGGFHTDWQNQVMKSCEGKDFYFLNPLEKESKYIKKHKARKWKNIQLTGE